jgi:short-subunit dehydrogenase
VNAMKNIVEEIREQVEVNFFGALHIMKATTTQKLKQSSGNTINITSVGSDFFWLDFQWGA